MERVRDNIVGHIKQNAALFPNKTAFLSIAAADSAETRMSFGELRNKIEALAGHLLSHSLYGKKALLIYEDILDFIISFFACQYIGTVAVPSSQLKRNTLSPKTLKIIKDAGIDVLFCSNNLANHLHNSLDTNNLKHLSVFATDLDHPPVKTPEFPKIQNSGISFIQYTSGSTDDPKGVVITHENLINNQRQIKQAFKCNRRSVIFSWLPFHHDMGLVGNIIHSIYVGCTCIVTSPYYFFQQPKKWIEAISKFKVTHSGGPNFAYDMAVSAMADSDLSKIDLSSWKVAFNGSEHVKADTIVNFSRLFEPCGFKKKVLYPCYGLAEATLLVSGLKGQKNPTLISIDKTQFVSCGKIPSNLNVGILSGKGSFESKDLQQGEICIAGMNVTGGYWNRPDRDFFVESGGRHYLKTGDIGFFYKNELFVIGRIKEMFIIRGKNYYPHDIEKLVAASHPELEANGVVAFENPHEKDGFIIAAELKRKLFDRIDLTHLIHSIDLSVVSDIGISPDNILLLKPHGIPRTTSGKPQRLLCRELYSKGNLPNLISKSNMVIHRAGPELKPELVTDLLARRDTRSIRNYLVHIIRAKSELTGFEWRADAPFEFNTIGIDSLKAVELINTINKDLDINLQAADIYKDNTLDSLIGVVEHMLWLKYSKAHGKEIVL